MIEHTLKSTIFHLNLWSTIYFFILFLPRYGLVAENASSLHDYITQGDNRNARLHTQIVATRLNRLHDDPANSTQPLRQRIRRAMLWALKDLPLRDEVSLIGF